LDSCLKNDGHVNGFEHNFQSFRAVTVLEKRYSDFDGLNLTFATLEGILKHSYPYKKSFLSDWVDEQFDLSKHPSVEAMIVDRADEIAYMSHDIDDGVHSGLITFEQLRENPLIETVLDKVYAEGIDEADDEMFRYRFSSHLINHLVYAILDYSKPRVSAIEQRRLESTEPLPIGFEPALETQIKTLKKILYRDLYLHKQIVRHMYAGKQAIKGLYAALMEEPKMLPRYFRAQLERRTQHRVIADYIASMSDRFAMKLYNELYGKIY
ncbi:MAG TPA: deoxyguanosinetriphosphate triphosphohydrolase, partial [Sulfuricurvum sp.]|nr:deoxyguanosinetriphosphate triphosphohydrolase [Sulfuricurvum sp.]